MYNCTTGTVLFSANIRKTNIVTVKPISGKLTYC